jgi:nitrogen fixation NifU-like protein
LSEFCGGAKLIKEANYAKNRPPLKMPVDEEDIYQEHVMDHYEDPYHRGQCSACTHAQEGKNPLCGDRVRLELQLDHDQVKQAWFEGEGCCISQAAASMLCEKIEGKPLEEVKQFSATDMLDLFGARLTPNRQKCCLLSWRVLQQAMHSPKDSSAA